MDYQLTWEDLDEDEGLLSLFERGPAPNMDEQQTPTPFRVVVDGEVVEVEADSAYDAVEKAQKAHEAAKKRQSKSKSR